MSLLFVDSPSLPPATLAAATIAATQSAVIKVWSSWIPKNEFPGAQSPVPRVTLDALSDALVEDNRNRLPFKTARTLVEAFAEDGGGMLKFQSHLSGASQRLKGIASELIATAASLAVAKTQGLGYIGARSDINLWFGAQVWTRLWNGDGPDYLLANHVGDVTFLEAKGGGAHAAPPIVPLALTFVTHKAQSQNAQLNIPAYFGNVQPSVRHILSRVTKEKDHRIRVQWFNNRPVLAAPVVAVLVLAVALSNFRQIAIAHDVDPFQQGTADASGYVALASKGTSAKAWTLEGSTSNQLPVVLVKSSVRQLFVDIKRFFENLRPLAPVFASDDSEESYPNSVAGGLFQRLKLERLLDFETHDSASLSTHWKGPVRALPMGYVVFT